MTDTSPNPETSIDTMVRMPLALHWRAKALAVQERLQIREWYTKTVLAAVEAAERQNRDAPE